MLGLQQAGTPFSGDLDLSSLYREGINRHGYSTYTPRFVLYDLNGSYGSIASKGWAYGAEEDSGQPSALQTWEGIPDLHKAEPIAKTDFIHHLESEVEEGASKEGYAATAIESAASKLHDPGTVRYFTDYLKAPLHHRTPIFLPNTWHGMNIDGFGSLTESFNPIDHEYYLEAVRYFAEESDSLQAFQCWVDDCSGFGKIASHSIQEIQDTFQRPVVLYTMKVQEQRGTAGDQSIRKRRISEALSSALLTECCDLYVPLTVPPQSPLSSKLRWSQNNMFQTTALLAAAIDTASLPCKLSTNSHSVVGRMAVSEMIQVLTQETSNSPLAALQMSMPCTPIDYFTAAQPFTNSHLMSLTAGILETSRRRAEVIVLRGPRSKDGISIKDICSVALPALHEALIAEGRYRCVQHTALTGQALPIPLPFPKLFSSTVGKHGDVLSDNTSESTAVHSVPVLTRLIAAEEFRSVLLMQQAKFQSAAGSVAGQALCDSWGYGKDEREEIVERMVQMASSYQAGDESD